MLPPINLGEDRMKIDDKEPPMHIAKLSNPLPAPSYSYSSAAPPTYTPYASTTASDDSGRRGSSTRSEQGSNLDGPLPSLRSVTGIGEALDTSRPPPPPPSSYPQSFPQPPAPLSTSSFPPPPPPPPSHATQSPTALRTYEASHFEQRPYDKTMSSYPPQFASHATSQAAPASAPAPVSTVAAISQAQPNYTAAPRSAHETHHWRSEHASAAESNHHYGHADRPSSYAQYSPTATAASARPAYGPADVEPVHPAHVDGVSERRDGVFRAEQHHSGTAPRRDEAQHPPESAHGRPYGDSVKRHLDHFDLENTFDEIADYSRSLWDFSQHFRNKAHQTQRSGPLPGSTPNLKEIEDMANQTARIQASLANLQEVVLSQQAALAERHPKESWKPNGSIAAEEAAAAPAVTSSSASVPAAPVPIPAPPPRDGFAGPDAKKKRGRAAPPGRCHSCNRAETPEWRRGPDGARTLCNACGLHYAKLTRKMGGNKAAGTSGSNLKPRVMSETSPT